MKKQRIVVKIGSSSLTNANGGICYEKLAGHVEALAALKGQGHEVVLISSGAVAAGFASLGYPSRPVTIKGKQAAAAVGQGLLMQAYTEAFRKHGMVAAQLLLTRQDFSRKEQYINAYATLEELLERSVLPIINENDSVAIEELTFGDNDMLSALVSGMIHANQLIILTDVNGLYTDNPNKNPDAVRIDFLPTISDEVLALGGGSGSKVGTGGMKSKLEAAKIALSLGVRTFIGVGHGCEKLIHIAQGDGDGTYVGGTVQGAVQSKKQWIGIHSFAKGRIVVDEGAVHALLHLGKSLLPAGVIAAEGTFQKGDVVEVMDEQGIIIGRGECLFNSIDLEIIKGKRSQEVRAFGYSDKAVVIHRNCWVRLLPHT